MRSLFSLLPCLLLAGCVSYEPAPVDWEVEVADWTNGQQCVTLSIGDALLRAIAFSPELNAVRLAHAKSAAKADASGYWDDPSLDLDVLRVLKEPKNPWTYGGSVSLTIPVTGIPGLERKAAEAYAAADRWEIIAAEDETIIEAANLAHTSLSLKRLTDFLVNDRRSESYRSARDVSRRLAESGELTKTEYLQQNVAENELDQALFELRKERIETESKLRRLTGIPPGCVLLWNDEDVLPVLTTNEVDYLDFVRAPEVQAALARYEGKETELKKEIRRQYPELSIGPAYTREDGFDKVGFTVGLSLPFWNRNRQGIAEAKGARDESRHAAIIAWRDAVQRYVDAQMALAAVGDWSVESSRAYVEELYEAGEITAGEYVASIQQDWNQYVNVFRRRIAAITATYRINVLVSRLKDEEGISEE